MINRYGWKIVSLGAAILTVLLAVPADSATLKANRVDVEYIPPKSSAHDVLYSLVRERRVLEKIRDLLERLRRRRLRMRRRRPASENAPTGFYRDSLATASSMLA